MNNDYCSQWGAKQEEKSSLILGDNLKVSEYRNGDPISLYKSNKQWIEFEKDKIGAYSINNNGDYLYNWYAVNDERELAPEGWHVPTDEEWSDLKLKKQLKENISYGGYRHYDNSNYYGIGRYGYFWSSTEYSSSYAWYRGLYYNYTNVSRSYGNKQFGFSVRCLKGEINETL